MLVQVTVVAHLDAKFIVINAQELLCVMDQHATDEHVHLESLEKCLFYQIQCQHGDSSLPSRAKETDRAEPAEDLIKSVKLAPPKDIKLAPDQSSLILQHHSLLSKWEFNTSSCKTSMLLWFVSSIYQKEATPKDFIQFLQALGCCTSDASMVKPPFIKWILASQVCQYAIMFGDVLRHEWCTEMIHSLAEHNFSFICAHGWPSVIPLIDLKNVFSEKPVTEGNNALKSSGLTSPGRSSVMTCTSEIPLQFHPRWMCHCHKSAPIQIKS